MEFTFWLKLAVILLGFALAAVEFDFFKDLKNEKIKKTLLGIIFITLLIFTVFDTTNDEVANNKADLKRDSLITVDSLRFAKIISNFQTNLNSVSETKDEIITLDSLLSDVKDTLQNQVGLLNDAVKKSKELVRLENIKFSLEKPDVICRGANTKITIDSLGNFEKFSFEFINGGKRAAKNIRIHSRTLYYNTLLNKLSFIKSKYTETDGFLKLHYIPPVKNTDVLTQVSVYPNINTSRFQIESNRMIFIFTIKYTDSFSGEYEKTMVISCSGFKNNKFDISQSIDESLTRKIKKLYKENGLSEYLLL